MGKQQIKDKLRNEFNKVAMKNDMSEKDVVYCLVEMRKMIEHDNGEKDFPAIKFYADWAVHVQKDYTPNFIKQMMVSGNELNEFIKMDFLKEEFRRFFARYTLPDVLIQPTQWNLFQENLMEVLSEQPMIIKNNAINKFTFLAKVDGVGISYTYDETA